MTLDTDTICEYFLSLLVKIGFDDDVPETMFARFAFGCNNRFKPKEKVDYDKEDLEEYYFHLNTRPHQILIWLFAFEVILLLGIIHGVSSLTIVFFKNVWTYILLSVALSKGIIGLWASGQ